MTESTSSPRRGGMMRVARSRGALSGLLVLLLGLWGALIPFIGPIFDFAFTPATSWTWTSGRFWLEVLPGVAAVVGGLMLMVTANRAVGVFAGYLASAAGAWFVVGPVLGRLWGGPEGAAGSPVGSTARQVWEQISFFSGLGVVILFFAAQALGRFTVRSVRDVRAAEKHARNRTGDDSGHRGPDSGDRNSTTSDTAFIDNRTAPQSAPVAGSTGGATRAGAPGTPQH
jgi:hypothetical protein